jgi:hypothetical protein
VSKRTDVINVDGSTLNTKVMQKIIISNIAFVAGLLLEATR